MAEPKNDSSIKDTILLIKIPGCPACTQYDKFWPEVKKQLETRLNVNTESVTRPIPAGIYKDVDRFLGVNFPCIVKINGKSLENAKINNGGPLEVENYCHYKNDQGKWLKREPYPSLDPDSIIRWVNELNKKPLENLPNNMRCLEIDPCSGTRKAKKYSYA